MIEYLPNWIEILFIITCILTIVIFHFSNGKSYKLTGIIMLWSVMQSILALNGFYLITDSIPPRFGLVLIPPTILIVFGLFEKQREWILKNRKTELSTFLHTIRVPVEVVLFYLFLNNMIPELMTFEGRNFDIVVGITAPIIGILYLNGKISKQGLFIWNVIGLFLVFFIFINGILSSELPFQQFGFEQPNRGINYFPFVLLPATIIPIVIYTHIIDLIKLKKEIKACNKI